MKTLDKWFLMENASFGASSNMKASKDVGVIKRGIEYHRWVYKTLKLQCDLNHGDKELVIEPWFRTAQWKQRSPDALLIDHASKKALVIEVKLNWKDGRDEKLLQEYLPIVSSALEVETYPLLITNNIRGLAYPPLLGVRNLLEPFSWTPAKATPVLLMPKRG